MKVGDLVCYKNTMNVSTGVIVATGKYAFACDVVVYWHVAARSRSERSGDLMVLTSS